MRRNVRTYVYLSEYERSMVLQYTTFTFTKIAETRVTKNELSLALNKAVDFFIKMLPNAERVASLKETLQIKFRR